MINILNMNFDENNAPNFGSIAFDRSERNIVLLSTDISKLNSMLTRAVCIGTYGAGTFYFRSGDLAYVPDTQRLFMYESTSDTWHEQEV